MRRRDPKRLVEHLVEVVGKDSEEEVMTVADWLRSEGRTEGRAEAARRTLLKLLRSRFGEVPAEVGARIQAAGAEQLDTWFDRALAASSIDEALAAT